MSTAEALQPSEQQAFSEGLRAGRLHLAATLNPYQYGSDLYKEWYRGVVQRDRRRDRQLEETTMTTNATSYRNGIPGHYDKRGIWREGETATPRTSAALSKVSDARHADKNNSRECHALIQSHVRLEMDYNDLRAETAELRHVLLSAAVLRPKLLIQYGAVPECVLDFCNRARAALEAAA